MRTRAVPILMAVTATFLLAACASTATGAPIGADMSVVSGEAAGAPVSEEFVGSDQGGSVGQSGAVDQKRQVITTAYVSMRVEDVGRSAGEVRDLVARRNGLIASEDAQNNGESNYATITAQVPAADLDAFIADVSAMGTVDAVNVTAQDVTTQVVDLDARIAALKTSIDRMSVLLARADRIEDLLAIETQLSTRQAELDSLTAQRTWLGDQVALSSVTISLSPTTPIIDVEAPGFLSGLRSGWAAFVSATAAAVTALGFLLPFGIVLLLVLVPLVAIAVRQSRRHAHLPAARVSTPAESVDSLPIGG